jgi:hypothetical protein
LATLALAQIAVDADAAALQEYAERSGGLDDFLTRHGQMWADGLSHVNDLVQQADGDGPFGEHVMGAITRLLSRHPDIVKAMKFANGQAGNRNAE